MRTSAVILLALLAAGCVGPTIQIPEDLPTNTVIKVYSNVGCFNWRGIFAQEGPADNKVSGGGNPSLDITAAKPQ